MQYSKNRTYCRQRLKSVVKPKGQAPSSDWLH